MLHIIYSPSHFISSSSHLKFFSICLISISASETKMAQSNVPQFGKWEDEDNVPYTVFFEKARKNRGGKMINPNDPQENPGMFPNTDPSPLAPAPPATSRTKPEEPIGRGAVRPSPEHRVSREDGEFKQFSNSPAHGENTGQRTSNEYGGRGQRPARSARPSGGSEQSFERSPLHPHYQAKVTGRGNGSPAWEGKNHDGSHGTPGRSRLRPTTPQGDESPEKGAAVPRFGEWDENDPRSAENFTHIFNQLKKEKNNGAGNVPGTPRGGRGQQANSQKKCCFPWW